MKKILVLIFLVSMISMAQTAKDVSVGVIFNLLKGATITTATTDLGGPLYDVKKTNLLPTASFVITGDSSSTMKIYMPLEISLNGYKSNIKVSAKTLTLQSEYVSGVSGEKQSKGQREATVAMTNGRGVVNLRLKVDVTDSSVFDGVDTFKAQTFTIAVKQF